MKKLMLFCLFLFSVTTYAEESKPNTAKKFVLTAAVNSSSGAYAEAWNDLLEVCQNDIQANSNTGGAVGNLNVLDNDRTVVFALAHMDLYEYYGIKDPNYITDHLIVQKLGNEQVHIIVSKVPKFTNYMYKDITFNSITDLKGFPVGGSGGGVFTARVLNKYGNYGFSGDVKEFSSGDELLDAVVSGKIAAAIMVGKNLPILKDPKWKDKLSIITTGTSIPEDLKKYYSLGGVNYPGFTRSMTPTFETPAIIISRNWDGEKKKQAVEDLKTCINNNKGTLSDLGGFWKDIKPKKQLE